MTTATPPDVAESLPDTRVATGSYTLSAPAAAGKPVTSTEFEGDVAKRSGMGGLAAVDEVTMVVMPQRSMAAAITS